MSEDPDYIKPIGEPKPKSKKEKKRNKAVNTEEAKPVKVEPVVEQIIEPKVKPDAFQKAEAKYIPISYATQDLKDPVQHDDGSVTRTVDLSDPIVPAGENLDPDYLTQTQIITYRDNKRVGCVILDKNGNPLGRPVNTPALDN